MSTLARWHVWVEGRVQGVGYRMFVQRKARELGLVGYVHNLPDGRVETVVEGPTTSLEKLKRWLEHGPRHARVRRVHVVTESVQGGFKRFSITSE